MRDPTQIQWNEVLSMDSLKTVILAIGQNWWIKFFSGMLVSANDWLFHPRHDIIEIVLVFIILDTVTGVLKACKNSTVSSSGFFRFSIKVAVYMTLLAVGSLLDKLSLFGSFINPLSVVATYLALTESLSVLENIAGMGFDVPSKLVSMIKFAKGDVVKPSSSKGRK